MAALRGLTAAAVAIAAWQLYAIARDLDVEPWLAVLPGLILAGVLYAAVPGYSHHWIPLPLIWGAVLAAMRGAAHEGLGAWAVAGLLLGLTTLTVHLDGLATGAALAAWIALDAVLGPASARLAGRRFAALIAGGLAPIALAAGVLASQGALVAAYDHIWGWTLCHYKQAGRIYDVKFPTDLGYVLSTQVPGFRLWKWYAHAGVSLYAYALPVGMAIVALARAADLGLARLRGGGPWAPATGRLAMSAILTLAAFAALTRGKADYVHVYYYLAPAVLFATALAARWRRRFAGPGQAVMAALPALSLAGFLGLGVLHAGAELWLDPKMRPAADGPDARMHADPAAAWLRTHAEPGDRLAVYPLGPQWYVYALPPATRFTTMLHPSEGYYDQADWEAFWGDIEMGRPRFVMLGPFGRTAPTPEVPLTGYRRVQALPIAYMGDPRRVEIYEREAPKPAAVATPVLRRRPK